MCQCFLRKGESKDVLVITQMIKRFDGSCDGNTRLKILVHSPPLISYISNVCKKI